MGVWIGLESALSPTVRREMYQCLMREQAGVKGPQDLSHLFYFFNTVIASQGSHYDEGNSNLGHGIALIRHFIWIHEIGIDKVVF